MFLIHNWTDLTSDLNHNQICPHTQPPIGTYNELHRQTKRAIKICQQDIIITYTFIHWTSGHENKNPLETTTQQWLTCTPLTKDDIGTEKQ